MVNKMKRGVVWGLGGQLVRLKRSGFVTRCQEGEDGLGGHFGIPAAGAGQRHSPTSNKQIRHAEAGRNRHRLLLPAHPQSRPTPAQIIPKRQPKSEHVRGQRRLVGDD
jgi:hypothetical protein